MHRRIYFTRRGLETPAREMPAHPTSGYATHRRLRIGGRWRWENGGLASPRAVSMDSRQQLRVRKSFAIIRQVPRRQVPFARPGTVLAARPGYRGVLVQVITEVADNLYAVRLQYR